MLSVPYLFDWTLHARSSTSAPEAEAVYRLLNWRISKWRIFSPLNNVNILEDSSDFAYLLGFFHNLAILLFSEIILFMIDW